MPRIGIDVDSTLAAIHSRVGEKMEEGGEEGYDYEDIRSWDWPKLAYGEERFLETLWDVWRYEPFKVEPLEDGLAETIDRLHGAGHFVAIPTHQPDDEEISDGKREWLAEQGIRYDAFLPLTFDQPKFPHVDALVDDKPTTPHEAPEDTVVYLRDQPFNRDVDLTGTRHERVHSVREAVDLILMREGFDTDEAGESDDPIDDFQETRQNLYSRGGTVVTDGSEESRDAEADFESYRLACTCYSGDTDAFSTTDEATDAEVAEAVEEVETDAEMPSGDEVAGQVLENTAGLVTQSRDTHGDAVENQEHIAQAWTWYLRGHGKLAADAEVRGADVARMMTLLKMSRGAVGEFDLDHDRDSVGYSGIAAACEVTDDPSLIDEVMADD